MKKASLIGLFLAAATMPSQRFTDLPVGRARFPVGIAPTVSINSASRTSGLFTSFEQGEASLSETPRYGGWWVLVAALLFAALVCCLLILLRRRKAMLVDMEKLRADRKVLFDGAPCGYHAIDSRGRIIHINETLLRWLEYEKDEVVERLNFVDLMAGERLETGVQLSTLLNRASSGSVHVDLLTKNGKRFPVMLSEVANRQGEGKGSRLFTTLNNAECREALERISTLHQELESFSYSISHDLRAPLRSIDGYSKILQEDYAPQLSDEGRRVLNVIMNNAKRMGMLIDDLLEFGRLGRKVMQPSYINMTATVKLVVQETAARYAGRNVEVKVGDLHAAFADADMIRQVWLSLVDNAYKYSAKSDPAIIEIRSFENEQHEYCYEVKDNGVGFDMKYAPKLFGVFQRLHKIQDFAGTGVGLAIVKRIVDRHKGRVWTDASLDRGAIFYFTIPVDNEHE